MRKATATYNAPKGDNKVVEMGGVTFYHGQPVDLNSDDHEHLINKFEGNPHFDIIIGDEMPSEKKKLGRPSNADKAAAEALKAEQAKLDPAAQQAAQLAQKPV